MAERQVGERLSEQAAEITKLWLNYPCGNRLRLVAEQYDSLVRQLAEAERENGRLREALDRIADGRHPTKKTSGELSADGYLPGKKGTMVYVKTLTARDIARVTLNPPDPPASPAEGSEAATEVEA